MSVGKNFQSRSTVKPWGRLPKEAGNIIEAFEKKVLKHCQGWSRHIDLGLVQEDGLGCISMSLPAIHSCDFSENLRCALQLHTDLTHASAAICSNHSLLDCGGQN